MALELREQGLSVVPVKANKTTPLNRCSPYQNRLMTDDELRRYFTANTYGLAIICGRVSGHLLTLDFDNDDGLATKRFNAWSEAVLSGKPHLYTKLVITTSPSGGYHVRLRCTEPVGGNDKLAKSKDGQTTLIETRGEGGYAVAPPTPGYELTQGTLTNPPTISADDRAYLMATARQFNQVERKPENNFGTKVPKLDGQQKAGHLYNQTDGYRELLTRHEWTLEKAFDTQERWLRPGSDSDSSATFHTDSRRFNVFTPNAGPLEDGGSYDPYGLLARLEFDGNYTAATRHLYAEHPEWQIPSNGYKPGRPEQAASDDQLERMAGLHSERPKEVERPADSRDAGRAHGRGAR